MKQSEWVKTVAKFIVDGSEVHIYFADEYEATRAVKLYRMIEDGYFPVKTRAERFIDARIAGKLLNADVIDDDQYAAVYNF